MQHFLDRFSLPSNLLSLN